MDTYEKAVNKVQANRREKTTIKVNGLIKRLAKGDRLSSDRFAREGELPKMPGKSITRFFYAIKVDDMRAYIWKSDKHENTYFISHYVYKDQNKLKLKDITKAGNNWKKIEL